MRRYLFVAALLCAGAAGAQAPPRVPTPDEIAFAQLPRDVQA